MPEAIRTVDIHGMSAQQAKVCLLSELKRAKGVYRLRVVHGFHGGTALRDLVRREIGKNKSVLRVEVGLNPGETDLVLKEF